MKEKLEKQENRYINKKFGRLTVVKFSGYNKHKQSIWLFECECGNKKELILSKVKNGIIKSCGCITKEGIGVGVASFNEVYSTYKRRAIKKEIPFEITREEFKELTKHDCFYCGTSPNNKSSKSPLGEYTYNGLDRLDSTKGYTLNNVVPCCKKCNEAKMDLSPSDFYLWVEKAYLFMKKHETYFIKKGMRIHHG